MGASQFFVKMKGRRRGEGVEKTKGDPLAMPALRTTPLSQTWPQLLQPLGFTRRTIIWDAPLQVQQYTEGLTAMGNRHRLDQNNKVTHLESVTIDTAGPLLYIGVLGRRRWQESVKLEGGPVTTAPVLSLYFVAISHCHPRQANYGSDFHRRARRFTRDPHVSNS